MASNDITLPTRSLSDCGSSQEVAASGRAVTAAQHSGHNKGMPTSFLGKSHERFVIVATLLHLIDPVRGEPTTYSLDRHPHDDLWKHSQIQKKFLDSFALISSTSRVGRDTAAAVCLEQGHPSGTILRLARNLGVPEDVASRLQGILHDLNAVALREKRPQDVENEILLKIATLTQDKIQALLERICRREVQDSIAETTAKRLPLDDMEDANFREWASNLSLLASLDPTSDPAFLIPHIRWASRARWSYSEELEALFALEDGSLPLWLKDVYKIGRYYAATKAMLKLAVKEPKIFTGIHVQPVEAPRQENFSLGNQKEPLLTVLTKMALADPQKLRQELGRTWLTDDPETKFRRACRVNLIVHAEMQLISFYDHHPDLIPRLLFMGTSKKACYLCHEYMSRHPLTIGISASHQKLYPAWLLAPCSSAIRKKHKALLWEFSRHLEETAAHELQTRLGIRRPATMDSTAGPSMTTTATLSTGFWSSKPSLSDEVTDEETLSGASEIK